MSTSSALLTLKKYITSLCVVLLVRNKEAKAFVGQLHGTEAPWHSGPRALFGVTFVSVLALALYGAGTLGKFLLVSQVRTVPLATGSLWELRPLKALEDNSAVLWDSSGTADLHCCSLSFLSRLFNSRDSGS